VEDVGWVVHILLKGSIEMGEGLRATGEPETLAEVVTTLGAKATIVAHDAGLNSYALANHEILNTRTNRGYDASGLVAEDQGSLEDEVAVPAMDIVMDWKKWVSVGTGVGRDGDVRSLPQRPVATTLT